MFRIIIVEDEMLVRKGMILTTDWAKLDCEIIAEAANGEEGEDLILKHRPDIVISDIKMPKKNGIELIEAVLVHYQPVFILLTAYSDFEYARKAINLNVLDYLLKPFNDQEFIEVIERAKRKVLELKRLNNYAEKADSGKYAKYLSVSVNSKHQNIIKAIEYVTANFQRNLSIADVCDYLDVSESYLSHLFRTETDYSFHEYLTLARMREAAHLLKDANLKIYDVADRVGFNDQRYFSAVFKRYFNVTPMQYKEQLEEKNEL